MPDEEIRNVNFVQIDRRVMAAHRKLMVDSPIGAVVLSLFSEYMDKSNAIVISYATLQESTGYSRAAIGKAIKHLKDEKWIQAIKIGTANVYVVNSAAFWTASSKGKYYSRFHATVIASATEQAMTVEKLKKVELRDSPMLNGSERVVLSSDPLPPPDQTDIDLD